MSYSFDARFSPTKLDLAEILARLGQCLHDSRIDYGEEIMQLHSRGGEPTVLSMTAQRAPTLADVATVAKSWWGVSFAALSGPLFDVLGKTDSIEVYLQIFKLPAGERMVIYNESSGAFRARTQSEELTADLIALLVRIADALEVELAVYDEQGEDTVVLELRELEERLATQAGSKRALGWAAVVASRSMNFARTKELAGPWADRVRLSTADYVVLPFLAGELAP